FRQRSYTYAEVRPMFKKLLNNKDKLIELRKTPLNKNCSAIVLKKLLEKLGDPGGIDSESEEIEDFLNDNSIQFGVEDSPFNMDKDILFLESLLRDDPIPPHPIIPNQIEETNHSLKIGKEPEGTCRLHQPNGDVIHNQPTSS
nr:reverse transcriptase domain-containing protein [Tanacetum cinerariifolium]